MIEVEVYADGSATTPDKEGGYGWVLVVGGVKVLEGSGHMDSASNNDAELEAAIQGLAAVIRYHSRMEWVDEPGKPSRLPIIHTTLISDSRLILGWTDGSYKFKQVNKLDQFKKLQYLAARLQVKTKWVRGHSGNEHNERCDKLANAARLGIVEAKEREEKKAAGDTLIGTKKSGTVNLWYKGVLKVIDLDKNIIEDHDRDIHGHRGSMLEIKEERSR